MNIGRYKNNRKIGYGYNDWYKDNVRMDEGVGEVAGEGEARY